jgi:hypothetical protein
MVRRAITSSLALKTSSALLAIYVTLTSAGASQRRIAPIIARSLSFLSCGSVISDGHVFSDYTDKQAKAFIIKRRELKATGVCSCKAHHPLVEGRSYCKDCGQIHHLIGKIYKCKNPDLKKEYQALLLTIRTKVYQENALRDLGKVPDNMQRLMELGYMTNHGKSFNTKQLFETRA